MKDANLRLLSEHNIITSYVYPTVRFLVGHDAMTVPYCANFLVDNEDAVFDKQPDYITNIYDHYEFSHSTVSDKSKIENALDLSKIIGFYRLALFGKQALEKHRLNGDILFQSTGKY
ncbi:hypothetical protein BCV72DRAFT_316242 [Rhizopus microsporus var. microsporus]|uniref:Uncharacterized protein n=1 Tax=Rhizopus microsporus var. microsporus TaxID=86635 RepID=A0A1X0RDF8_RHIZD|nr:hypothetical protein BCV72DRAFT_316242 [Rhizopus microsporus var. microsporus]